MQAYTQTWYVLIDIIAHNLNLITVVALVVTLLGFDLSLRIFMQLRFSCIAFIQLTFEQLKLLFCQE